VDNGFQHQLTGWSNGDFNYDGKVNFDDYVVMDLNFNQQGNSLLRAMSFLDGSDRSDVGMDTLGLLKVEQHFAQFGDDYAQHFLAAVPEPAGLAMLMAIALGGGRRARRSRRAGS
jgi:hypothetical protein